MPNLGWGLGHTLYDLYPPMCTDHKHARSPLFCLFVFRKRRSLNYSKPLAWAGLSSTLSGTSTCVCVCLHACTHGMRCLSRTAKKDPTCRSQVDSFEQWCTNLRPFVPIPETVFLFHFLPPIRNLHLLGYLPVARPHHHSITTCQQNGRVTT